MTLPGSARPLLISDYPTDIISVTAFLIIADLVVVMCIRMSLRSENRLSLCHPTGGVIKPSNRRTIIFAVDR
jgi:hypothetical protein